MLNRVVRELSRPSSGSGRPAGAARRGPAPARRPAAGMGAATGYPGDYTGPIRFEYGPDANGQPDPGEIVWGWVPYQEDHSRGKDRPVLLVGRDGPWLLGVMLTSKDNTNGHHRHPDYLDIGTGAWDRQARPSEVKLDRVIRLAPQAVRREGAILDERRFRLVADHLRQRR